MKDYDKITGLPADKNYLECGLPKWLKQSILDMQKVWEELDSGKTNNLWDAYYCNLQSDINVAEVEQMISSEQAWYLREKYLRIERRDNL